MPNESHQRAADKWISRKHFIHSSPFAFMEDIACDESFTSNDIVAVFSLIAARLEDLTNNYKLAAVETCLDHRNIEAFAALPPEVTDALE